MTLGQLQTLTLSWLDDLNAGYFTLPQVNVWLNNAQRECQKQLIQAGENFYVKRSSSATVQNADTYALPTDFLKVNKLEVVLSGTGVNEVRQTFTPVTLIQIDQMYQLQGVPAAYVLRKNCFTVRPIPDNTYTLYLSYSYRVTDMVNTSDSPDVPEQYHEYLAILATLDGFLKDQRDPNPMLVTKRDFYLALMKQDSEERTVDAPRMVIMTEDGGYGGSLW